jgi:hypothetical protein
MDESNDGNAKRESFSIVHCERGSCCSLRLGASLMECG